MHARPWFLLLTLLVSSCNDRDEAPTTQVTPSVVHQELPDEFEALVAALVDGTSEEHKLEIREAPIPEMMVDHFGLGLSLRNGELNRTDSEVRKLLVRRGIFHRDDLSSIVLLSVVRRIRGEEVDLDGQIKYYRDYWQKVDEIAPLDLECPTCSSELDPGYLGSGVSPHFPDRTYFMGACVNRHQFYYYHTDGWRTPKEIEGEQAGADQPATAPGSKTE